MGIKIHSIELKDYEVVEVEGEFEKRYINPKKYPAFLTHRALAKGRNQGITNSSLISELLKLNSLSGEDGKINAENISPEQAELLDNEKYLPVIYLGIIGANKSSEMSYEDFLDKYHGDIEQTINDYVALIQPYIQENPNQFKSALEASTKK
jgi:hypothetical protein